MESNGELLICLKKHDQLAPCSSQTTAQSPSSFLAAAKHGEARAELVRDIHQIPATS